MQLKPYQQAVIDRLRDTFRMGYKAVLVRVPTGGGKTVIAGHAAQAAIKKGRGVWFLAHRRELVMQASRTMNAFGIEHGIVNPSARPRPNAPMQIGTIGTIANRLDQMPPPAVVIWDECHHATASTYKALREKLTHCHHVGLTATPQRLDGRGLDSEFEVMIEGPSTKELILSGDLAPFRLFAPSAPDLTAVRTVAGDYHKGELSAAVEKSTVTGDAIEHYQRIAAGRRAIVFCVSVKHSQEVAAQFNAAGISCEHIDGDFSHNSRDAAIRAFTKGDVKALCSVDLVSEGFDVPAIEVAILLRPTKSLSLFLQQTGRALRTFDGKSEAIILDHAGNTLRHGMPDADRQWTLAGSKKKARQQKIIEAFPVRQCPDCYRVWPAAAQLCGDCGASLRGDGRKIAHVDGRLVEVSRDEQYAKIAQEIAEKQHRKREVAMAKTREHLEKIAAARGYQPGWVNHMMRVKGVAA